MAVSHTAVAAEAPLPITGRTIPARTTELPHRAAKSADEPAWPAATQVWNWAEGVVLLGYGPSAAQFL